MTIQILMYIQIFLSLIILFLIFSQPSKQQNTLFHLSEGTDALFSGKKIKNKQYIYRKLTWLFIFLWIINNLLMLFLGK